MLPVVPQPANAPKPMPDLVAKTAAPLPIDGVLSQLRDALCRSQNVVLVAAPGAGKTTRIPLALLHEPWLARQTIILLEPRRLAARAAAERMAATLGERVGETVGLRIRLEARVSARTRIEVVTEGVFARRIVADPALEGVGAVLFDEFHERSLDGDFGLALALDAQGGLREDLRLLVMSATLDSAGAASFLDNAPVIVSEGRAFPVDTRYLGRNPGERVEDAVVRAVRRAVSEESGSILAFLPGQGEIERAEVAIAPFAKEHGVTITPLYGAMDKAAQDRAVLPMPGDGRKIVLATSVAETSLTIEGVRVVIDSGVSRVPVFEPDLGLTRLETVRASRASVDQRRGRAGRTEPGVCYRLWEQASMGALPAFTAPEILSADISSLVLDLAEWGVRERGGLRWLDPPPAPAWSEASALLQALGATDGDGAITDTGRAMRSLGLPPRLARMVLAGAAIGAARGAAEMAIVMSERGLGGPGPDLEQRLERFGRDRSSRAQAARRLAHDWARRAVVGRSVNTSADLRPGVFVALAFPDRIAKARGAAGAFLMANGRAASVDVGEALSREPYLAIAEIAGSAARTRILAAAAVSIDDIVASHGASIRTREETTFDLQTSSLRHRRVRTLGAIVIAQQALPLVGDQDEAVLLAEGVLRTGVGTLPWTRAQAQLRRRVAFLRDAGGTDWPDLSDGTLQADSAWLSPFLSGRSARVDVSSDVLADALSALLPFELASRLDREAPAFFTTPAGSEIAIDYESDGGPFLDVRVQELFGLARHPVVGRHAIPLTLRLLSPAQRPIQITRDLPGFWRGSWAAVRADLRGRYPRHPWPEDPLDAEPTRRAKPRGS